MSENSKLPLLYVFSISHYCEKARWALDWSEIAYQTQCMMPVAHMEVMQKLGAAGTSVPLLQTQDTLVHGSDAILDWIDKQPSSARGNLAPPSELNAQCQALEKRLDELVGVHARRYFYSEALVEHPDTVLSIFCHQLPAEDVQALTQNWPVVCELMIGAMNLGYEQGQESRQILEVELDWLDGLLADKRQFLVGNRFSRADITAASLLAPLALPPEHPTYSMLQIPPRAQADFERWAQRPIAHWVRETYRKFRL